MQTNEDARSKIHCRVLQCQIGFIFFCVCVLILSLLLTLFADEPGSNKYGLGIDEGITISNTMTGSYSKTVALVLTFVANLHFISISHYQWVIFEIMANEMLETATITEWTHNQMKRTNNTAYVVGTLGAFSLQSIVIFDVDGFLVVHMAFACAFFISCMVYAALMSANEGILRRHGVIGQINTFGMVLVILMGVFFAVLVAAGVWGIMADDLNTTPKIMKAACEYGFMATAALLIASRDYVRAPLFNQFNFEPLLHCRLFSITYIVWQCFYVDRKEKSMSNDEEDEAAQESEVQA